MATFWTPERTAELARRYPVEGWKPFAADYGISKLTVTGKAIRMGLRSLNHHRHRSKSLSENNKSVNWRYFETWSPSMAWILGYIWADGCVRPLALRFRCVTDDEEILHIIKAELQSAHKISRHPAHVNNQGYLCKPESGFVISSAALSQSLQKTHGIMPNKTYLDLPFPSVPAEYLPHFARGNFDGDGFVCLSARGRFSLAFGGQRTFVTELCRRVCQAVGVALPRPRKPGQHHEYFVWQHTADIRAIHRWMYPDGVYPSLSRKRILLEQAANSTTAIYGRMPKDITWQRLLELFEQHGTWKKVAIALNVSEPCVHLHRKKLKPPTI